MLNSNGIKYRLFISLKSDNYIVYSFRRNKQLVRKTFIRKFYMYLKLLNLSLNVNKIFMNSALLYF